MRFRLALLTIAVLAPAHGAAHPGRTGADGCHQEADVRHCHRAVAQRYWARATVLVHEVVDGDTIKATTRTEPRTRLKVRLRGIDCPEMRDAGGPAATAHLTARLLRKTIVLQSGADVFETDPFGRTLAYAEYMGVDLGEELIAKGLCADFSHKYPHPRQARYLRAQQDFSAQADSVRK